MRYLRTVVYTNRLRFGLCCLWQRRVADGVAQRNPVVGTDAAIHHAECDALMFVCDQTLLEFFALESTSVSLLMRLEFVG